MQFDRPEYIHLVWVFVVLWFFVTVWQKTRRSTQENILGKTASQFFYKNLSRGRVAVKWFLLCAAWVLLVLASMGPRMGLKKEEVKQRGLDLMICIDVSRSMMAEDVPPNRLTRTKLDVKDMVSVLKSDRVGLIAFAGAAVATCPLTNDLKYFNETLTALSTKSAPRGGTFIGDAIRKALKSFGKSEGRSKVVFVITDGEDQDSFPLEAAKEAANQKVKIFTVGIGGADRGSPIPIVENGIKKYLKYQGETVLTRMNGEVLKKIAILTEGVYVPAGTSLLKLDEIYEKYIIPLDRVEGQNKQISYLEHQFQCFVLVALCLSVLEMFLSTRRRLQVEV